MAGLAAPARDTATSNTRIYGLSLRVRADVDVPPMCAALVGGACVDASRMRSVLSASNGTR